MWEKLGGSAIGDRLVRCAFELAVATPSAIGLQRVPPGLYWFTPAASAVDGVHPDTGTAPLTVRLVRFAASTPQHLLALRLLFARRGVVGQARSAKRARGGGLFPCYRVSVCRGAMMGWLKLCAPWTATHAATSLAIVGRFETPASTVGAAADWTVVWALN